jgi:hypothetical protein
VEQRQTLLATVARESGQAATSDAARKSPSTRRKFGSEYNRYEKLDQSIERDNDTFIQVAALFLCRQGWVGCSPRAAAAHRAAPASARRPPSQSEQRRQEQIVQSQDQQLELIGRSVGNLKEMGGTIGAELDEQAVYVGERAGRACWAGCGGWRRRALTHSRATRVRPPACSTI